MNKIFYSILAVFVAVAAAMIFMATRSGTSSVYIPSQLLSEAGDKMRVRVGGRVAESDINYQVEPTIELNFSVRDPGAPNPQQKIIPVTYKGIKPDMFAAGRDVIIDGDFVGGVLVASKLQTQCPSKYEAPSVDKLYPKKQG
ncbi:MAG: cytochrome c maturation protein CcmE [Oligoflexia bacterium]|nr:cytochrome c maturation protein CcmE [Oligoflexia bacterium]